MGFGGLTAMSVMVFGLVVIDAPVAFAATTGDSLGLTPIPAPSTVTVTAPPTVTVGSVAIAVPALPSASVTTSPATGVGISVTVPPSLGPVPLPALATAPISLTAGPAGIGIGVAGQNGTIAVPAPVVTPVPVPVVGGLPGAGSQPTATLSPVTGNERASTGRSPVTPVATPGFATAPAGGADNGRDPAHANAQATRSGATAVAVDGAVDASLRHAPTGPWVLARQVLEGGLGLWLVLALILAVARWAALGLLRDARRRATAVNPAGA